MLSFITAVLGLSAFAADDAALNYRGRSIDVKAYIEGFPFKNFHFSAEAGRAFFVRKGDVEHLYEARFEPGRRLDVDAAKRLSDIDFSKRNLWGAQASKATGRLYVSGDEDNTEIINLYEYADGGFKRLTDERYIYGWNLSPDGKKLAFSARSGDQEFTQGSVGVIDLETRTVTKLWFDSKALRTTWGAVSWSPDQSRLVLPVVCDEDRTHKNLLVIPVAGGEAKTLLDCAVKRSVYPAWEWLDDGSFVFTSDETDNDVAHRMEPATGKTTRLTDPAWNLIDAQLIEGKKVRLLALQRKPISTVLHVIDPKNGRKLWSKEYPATVSLVDGNRSTLLLSFTSAVIPFEIHSVALKGDEAKLTKVVDYDDKLKKKIVHCAAEKVSFATYDHYAAPGETQTLHAFLYTPVEPAKGDEARLFVESFYGGVNRYNAKIHMLCNAGFHVISPAPRGSWDWGREFHDKMQGDLGGGEILDVVEAAKTFSEKLKIPSRHVGAFGGSHGGYATLR
ncbi:MAG: prolyl oligopeptidase family serine peptidase, partial [Elusimicrobia bacterium]|nr:prolyl oligopeptidase family serine peptidase [Elusimicrobiota bacterium]